MRTTVVVLAILGAAATESLGMHWTSDAAKAQELVKAVDHPVAKDAVAQFLYPGSIIGFNQGLLNLPVFFQEAECPLFISPH